MGAAQSTTSLLGVEYLFRSGVVVISKYILVSL
jgi:hypothetical protein